MVVRLTAKDAKVREGKCEEALPDCARLCLPGSFCAGPGLLESADEACLAHEIAKQTEVDRQLLLPVRYDGLELLDAGYRLDLLISNKVVVELKAVERLTDLHLAQLMGYLRLGGVQAGISD